MEGQGETGRGGSKKKNEGVRGRERGRREEEGGRRIKESLHVCGTSSSQHFHII